jgi:hypothetical protein
MSINKYNKAMQFLLRPKYLRDDVIIQEDSNEPLVARAGFEEGTKLTDYVEANISGNTGSSTPGEGVKINNETFNAIVNLKIPYSDKLKLLGELGFGSNRTKVDLSEIGKKYGIDLGTETYKDKYSNYKVGGEYITDSGTKLRAMVDPENKLANFSVVREFANGGTVDSKIKMILDLLKRGADLDTISSITGVTIEEINRIVMNMKGISTEELSPEEPLSKNKTYSEIDILSNIDAKNPGGITGEDVVINPMPETTPEIDNYMPEFEGMEDPRYRQIGLAEGGRPIDTLADIAVEKSLFNPKQYGKVAKQIIKNPVVKQATKLIAGEIGLGVPFALDDYVEGYTPKEVLLNVATIGFGTSIKDDLDMLNTIGPKKEKLLQQYASKSAERRLNQRKGKENIIDKDMQEALNARDEFYSKLAEKRAKLGEQRLKAGEVESEARGLMGEAQMTEREGFAIGSISKATNWIDRDMNAIDVLIKTGRISRDQAFQEVGDLTFARQQGLSEAEFKSNNKQQEQKEPKKVNTYKKQPIQVNQASGLSIDDIMKKYG